MWGSESPAQTQQPLLQEFYLTEAERAEFESKVEAKEASPPLLFQLARKRVFAAVLILVLAVSAVAERVTFKVMVDKLENYRFFLMQMVAALNAVLMLIVTIWKRLRTKEITAEMQKVSKWYYVLMALLDTFTLMLTVIPGGRVPAPLTIVLLQSVTPINLIMSVILRSNRWEFHKTHYIGAFMILLAIIGNIVPLIVRDPMGPAYNADVLWNCVLFIGAGVPATLSMFLKESVLAQQQMNVYYLNFWVSLFQFMIGVVFAPLALPLQDLLNPEAWSSTGWQLMAKNWREGGGCLFAGDPSSAADFCWLAPLVLVVYVLSALAFNYLIMELVCVLSLRKTHYSIAASIPLAWVALELYGATSAVAQRHGQWPPWNPFDIAACVVVVVGLVIYHYREEPGVVADTPMPDNFAAVHHAVDKAPGRASPEGEEGAPPKRLSRQDFALGV